MRVIRVRLIRDIAYTVGMVFILLAAFETGLRLAGVHYQASLYIAEKQRGFALRPNSEGWETEENDNYVHINSDGLNDREHTRARPPGTLRIAVVGSSEAEARQIPRDQTFEAILERELSKATGKPVEVLNFGVPGYGLAQEYLTLKNHVWQYDPQIVLVAMSVFTVLKNVRSIYPGGDPGNVPFFTYQGGNLALDEQSRQAAEPDPKRLRYKQISSDLMNRSELLSLINEARLGLQRRIAEVRPPQPAETIAPLSKAPPSDYMQVWPYLETKDSQAPVDPRLQEAWRVAEDLLRMMHADASAHHAEFWLLTLDMVMQVEPNPQTRADFQQRNHLPTLLASDHRLDAFAQAEGIHSLLLAPPLSQYALDHKASLHGFPKNNFQGGHWNELGHEIAGKLIASRLFQESPSLRALYSTRE